MLTTTTTPAARAVPGADGATVDGAMQVTPLSVALDEEHAPLTAALGDLRALVKRSELSANDAHDLERDYVARYLRRVAELEERGALACTPDEWRRYVAKAHERTARGSAAKARRERLRAARVARDGVVVAPADVDRPLLAALTAADPDAEIVAIRASSPPRSCFDVDGRALSRGCRAPVIAGASPPRAPGAPAVRRALLVPAPRRGSLPARRDPFQ